MIWIPQAGPQTVAANSEAFEVLYGGEAGGGKSNLIQGIARTRHINSVIFRRTYTRLEDSVIPDTIKFYGNSAKHFNKSKHFWQFGSQRISLRQMEHEMDVLAYKSAQFDYIGMDELTEFLEFQYIYMLSRCRALEGTGQRTRVIAGSNPPTDNEGMWVFHRWAPWLDEKHPNPAKDGELRWYWRNKEGVELEIPENEIHKYDPEPLSRTFIRARLEDNKYLNNTSYRSTLNLLPEPYRSGLLEGVWGASIEDDRWQVIPTNWIKLAQERWKYYDRSDKNNISGMHQQEKAVTQKIDALGVDVAHGGKDKTVLSVRQNNYYTALQKIPGRETPDGQTVAQLIFKALDGKQHENTYVNIDATGVGASAYDFAKDSGDVRAFIAAGKSTAKDKSGKLTFVNKRAESYWLFREALDPQTGEDIALPPDQELLADLTAPRWKMMSNGIQIEKKEDLIKRLGRSPDCGDAVVLAFHGKNEAPASGAVVEMDYGMNRRRY